MSKQEQLKPTHTISVYGCSAVLYRDMMPVKACASESSFDLFKFIDKCCDALRQNIHIYGLDHLLSWRKREEDARKLMEG